jgi:hypothetical protein
VRTESIPRITAVIVATLSASGLGAEPEGGSAELAGFVSAFRAAYHRSHPGRRGIMAGSKVSAGSIPGAIWFAGWLFTLGFAQLVWWKAILGLVVWPYYLAVFLR